MGCKGSKVAAAAGAGDAVQQTEIQWPAVVAAAPAPAAAVQDTKLQWPAVVERYVRMIPGKEVQGTIQVDDEWITFCKCDVPGVTTVLSVQVYRKDHAKVLGAVVTTDRLGRSTTRVD